MTLFIDFDRTLFDTEKFRRALFPKKLLPLLQHPYGDVYKQYLYEDTITFLQMRSPMQVVLITAGPRWYQKMKVYRSGVTPYFNDIIFSGISPKGDILKERINMVRSPIVFVDDNPRHLESVRNRCPEIQTIRMRRLGEKYGDPPASKESQEVENLIELAEVLHTT